MMHEFVAALERKIDKKIRELHTAMPGVIKEFDPKTGLATVLPTMMYRKPSGDTIEYPVITGVPVLFPQGYGGAASVSFPVRPGDGCLIIIAEQSLEYWLTGHLTDTSLAFDLTNAICIPGLYNRAGQDAAEACEKNAVIIRSGSSTVKVSDGNVEIQGGNLFVEGDLFVKGEVIRC